MIQSDGNFVHVMTADLGVGGWVVGLVVAARNLGLTPTNPTNPIDGPRATRLGMWNSLLLLLLAYSTHSWSAAQFWKMDVVNLIHSYNTAKFVWPFWIIGCDPSGKNLYHVINNTWCSVGWLARHACLSLYDLTHKQRPFWGDNSLMICRTLFGIINCKWNFWNHLYIYIKSASFLLTA